jgi:thiosulfate/3-mercaptopyruvate sulfurtransferase
MFVETQWLSEHLGDQGIRIVDLRFSRCFSRNEKVAEECRQDYHEGHIPGAVYMDCMEDITDTAYKDIFYVTPPDHFREVMGRAGINNKTLVVCYDDAPYPLASARFWWTMLYFGHTRVKILNGGIRKWIKEGRSLSTDIPFVSNEDFTPKINDTLRATKQTVKKALNDHRTVIIDCLPYRQYHGKVRNSWSVRKGHIPNALWLPPMELVEGLDRASPAKDRERSMANDKPYPFFPIEVLRRIFTEIGVEPEKRVITYCGKGEAACSVLFALKIAGIEDVAIYDGSIAEWSRDSSLPMEKSEV